MGHVHGRQRQVRPEHRGNPLRLRKAEGGQVQPMPAPGALPHRLAGAEHHHDQERGRRGDALLLPAGQHGLSHGLPRRRRRPRHRLRRLADQLRQLDELLDGGVCPRRRLQHPRDLRRLPGARARHRQRVGPRGRRAPLHARRRGLRADQQARVARPAAPAEGEAQGRHRPRGAAEEQDQARPAGALPRRPAEEGGGARSSTSATSTSKTAPRRSRSSGRSASRSPRRTGRPATSPRSCTTSRGSSPTSTCAISPSSSRSSTTGR
jgi:hypothetical protein